MKICFLSLTHPYDYPRVLRMEAHSLAEAGHEITTVAPGGEMRFKQGQVNIELFKRPLGMTGRLIGLIRLFRIAIAIDADCYHCNEVESWLVGLFVKLLRPDRLVVFDVKEHYSSRFDEPHVAKWVKVIGKPFLLLFFRWLPRWTDFFIFAKKGAAEDFPNVDNSKYAFVHHYCHIGEYMKSSRESICNGLNVRLNKVTAIHIGGFSKARGWSRLLDALKLMKNQHMEVICLGDVHEGENVLISEAERLGVSHRIHLHEKVPYEQMLTYVKSACVGLMLYQPGIINHTWAFPMKMYDYMLEGLPIIGPRFAVEVASVVNELNCGLLVDTASSDEIAEALDWVCEHPLAAQEMGERGRQGVVQKYNWESEAKILIEIYDQLAAMVNDSKKRIYIKI